MHERPSLKRALLLLVLAACGSIPPLKPQPTADPSEEPEATAEPVASETPPPAPTAAVAPPAPADPFDAKDGLLPAGAADKIVLAGAPPSVRLIDPGGEPRAPLRYAGKKGSKGQISLKVNAAVTVARNEEAGTPTSTPVMVVGYKMSVPSADDKGTRVEATISDVRLEPSNEGEKEIVEALTPKYAKIKGYKVAYTLSPLGFVSDVETVDPPKSGPEVKALLANMADSVTAMATQLPEQDVGPGARWEVITRLQQNGTDVLQRTRYTLKERKGSAITIEATMRQVAARAALTPPNMPPGTSLEITAFKSDGTARWAMDLGNPTATQGRTQVSYDTVLKDTSPKQAIGKLHLTGETSIDIAGPAAPKEKKKKK